MGNKYMKSIWRLWAKSLGEKASDDDREADKIALIRTIIFLIAIIYGFITNTMIMIGIIHQW